MSIELLPPTKTYPAKYHVRQNFCRCHPETCCCDDWAVHLPSGKKYTTHNSKEVAADLAEWLNKQLDGQSNERP